MFIGRYNQSRLQPPMKTGDGAAKAIGLKRDAVRWEPRVFVKAATSELEAGEEDIEAAPKEALTRRRCLKL